MRVAVIGGTGHIGSFLVPQLVSAGHEVVSLSRGRSQPYMDDPAWSDIVQVVTDRTAEEATGRFGRRVAGLHADAVVDLTCFTTGSATQLVQALRGTTGHLLHCGSIWRYGPSAKLPIREDDTSPPVGEYGRQKAAIADLLAAETAAGGLPTTILHPGHITGPGWMPIGPLGNLDPQVWTDLSTGAPIAVPGLGAEVMHHVHAADIAQAFLLAIGRREAAAGEAFNVVAPSALTVRGYLEIAAGWFGHAANTRTVSWEEFRSGTTDEFAATSWEHLSRSQYASIDKARAVLGYQPRYEPEAAIFEAVRWLTQHDRLTVVSKLRNDLQIPPCIS